MRQVWVAVGVLGIAALGLGPALYGFGDRAQAPAAIRTRTRVPVVVELFTSEGCSSCPPADRVLARLAADQPVPAAQTIVLSEHVDYWNRLGWRDPFSSEAFSARQRAYDGAVFRSGQVYTPQMVIGGQLQVVGSDYPAVVDAIRQVAAQPQPFSVTLALNADPSGIGVHVAAAPASGTAITRNVEVIVALVEDGLTREVLAGENGGKTLSHAGVVRTLMPVGRITRRRVPPFEATIVLAVKPEWKLARMRVVAFAQEVESRQVLGAAVAQAS
jgi:hypothetical protein